MGGIEGEEEDEEGEVVLFVREGVVEFESEGESRSGKKGKSGFER